VHRDRDRADRPCAEELSAGAIVVQVHVHPPGTRPARLEVVASRAEGDWSAMSRDIT
jgi:hypothetical protein